MRSRTLTIFSGIGALVALVAMLVLVARGVDEAEGDAGRPALPGLPAGALTVGLQDERLPTSTVDEIPGRLDRLKASGATVTRVDVLWRDIAPRRPADPADPADPAYLWARTDAIVDGLAQRGITPIVGFSQTPAWANGNQGPEWVASPDDFGPFARAFADRYNGEGGHAKVLMYEPWTEPNNAATLMPQWEGAGASATPASPARYADLLARAVTEIRAVSPDAKVIGLGLADIAESAPGIGGVGVTDFLDALAGRSLEMDAASQHLLPTGPPSAEANRIPSVSGIGRLVERIDAVAPGAELLVTQVGYSTSPGGLSEAEQATYLTQTMTELARHPRVRLAVWYSVQDTLERPSGLLRLTGAEKPAWKAFVDTPKSLPSQAQQGG